MRRFLLLYNKKNNWLDRKVKLWRFYFCIKSEIKDWFNKDKRGSMLIIACGVMMLFFSICTIKIFLVSEIC